MYSDFRTQRISNPDGYAANVSAWQTALTNAVRAGLVGASLQSNQQEHDRHSHLDQHQHDVTQQRHITPGSDLLVLRSGDDLLRALETREWGRPLGLGAAVVCVFDFPSSLSGSKSLLALLSELMSCAD